MISTLNNKPVRVALAPPEAPLQNLGALVIGELLQRGLSCTLGDTSEPADLLQQTKLVFLFEVGTPAEREMERLVKAWQPPLFVACSAAPLAHLDFALLTVGERRPKRAWKRAVSNLRSVLTYYGAREVCPHRHAYGRLPRDFRAWIGDFISQLRPDELRSDAPMAAQ